MSKKKKKKPKKTKLKVGTKVSYDTFWSASKKQQSKGCVYDREFSTGKDQIHICGRKCKQITSCSDEI